MYLKRLESVGFKSFAERVQIEFVPGVTAIVGPNGSGKSNITDAIRWVLGEQSVRSLRGSRLEDIIFQGSDTRSPLNVAEVTLVLDNSDQALSLDYDEVSVTRRVYRSGDSEFYINKQACRLKDIIDLFMDSGLGQDAFSIISQGKVEDVLSSKAEERRVIFEEAAGVLKYKQRKKEATFKLNETNSNLDRVEDIIHEIEQQLDPLESQAKTAQQYLALQEQLKEEEIALLVTEIEQLHKEWQQLKQEVEDEKVEAIKVQTNIHHKEAQLAEKRQMIDELDQTIESFQENLLTLTQQVEHFEGQKQIYDERMKHFSENKQQIEHRLEQARRKFDTLQKSLHKEKEQEKAYKSARQQTKQKIDVLTNELETGEDHLTEEIDRLKGALIDRLNEQAAKSNEHQSITKQLEQLEHKKARHQTKAKELQEALRKADEKQQSLQKEFSDQQRNDEKLLSEINQYEQKIQEVEAASQTTQENLYKGNELIAKLTSKKEMLERMKEEYQGFYQGVQALLKAREKKELSFILGAVIERIDIPTPYTIAMETILGGQAQHIIVPTAKDARVAIDWLKRTNQGRATFLPLDTIKERFLPNHLQDKLNAHPGFIGIASDLVQTEQTYVKVVKHLMGHVIVTKTIKDANEIANIVQHRYRIVTLDGDVVFPGGSMAGGAKRKKGQSLFVREKELEETVATLSRYHRRAKELEEEMAKYQQSIQLFQDKLQATIQLKEKDEEKLQELDVALQEINMECSSLKQTVQTYDEDYKLLLEDEEILQTRRDKLDEELGSIEKTLTTIEQNIDQRTEEQKLFIQNKSNLREQIQQLHVSLAEQEERLKYQREKTITLEEQIKDAQNELQESEQGYQTLLEGKITEEERQAMDEHIEQKKGEKETLLSKIQEKRAERLEASTFIADEERELKELQKLQQQWNERIQQKEVKVNRLDVTLDNKLKDLQSTYTVTFEKAKTMYEQVEHLDESRQRVEQLKQSMRQLGPVNVGAIDEFKRISERYTFLSEQRNDLVEAKQTLYEIIHEMDRVMKEEFAETFEHIKKEFAIVFKELFNGGRAELSLSDPDNLLETGIDIIAQPPGKKLQHLGLLSGGERALTAIALLFAILRVRPVPFCVLDEVEAALDEANVVRFAKYVKMHSKDTQFIVITHRKGTMEEADVLYGITMQESGVSRLVSVQLEETEALLNA